MQTARQSSPSRAARHRERQVLHPHQGRDHALAAPGHARTRVQHADAGMTMKRVLVAAAAALSALLAQAQEYPVKTIRLIVPLTTGAGADIAGRIVAQRMSEHWQQPVIVEHRPGAGGQIRGKTPYVMVVPGNGPYRSRKLLLDAARAKPGEIAYSAAVVGTSTHLA